MQKGCGWRTFDRLTAPRLTRDGYENRFSADNVLVSQKCSKSGIESPELAERLLCFSRNRPVIWFAQREPNQLRCWRNSNVEIACARIARL